MSLQRKFVYLICIFVVAGFLVGYSFKNVAVINHERTDPNLSGEIKADKIEPFTCEDFSIMGVIAGELYSESDIIKKLGKPNKVKFETLAIGRKRKNYIYHDFTIKTDIIEGNKRELVTWIEIIGTNIKTKRGIGIGDKAEQVLSKYGPPTDKGDTYFYSVLTDSGYDQPDSHKVWFTIKNGKVTKISME